MWFFVLLCWSSGMAGRALLPSNETVATWTSIQDAGKWAKIGVDDMKKFLEGLGDESLDDLPVLVSVDTADIRKSIADANFNPIVKSKFAIFLNGVRFKFELEPLAWFGEAGKPTEVPVGGGGSESSGTHPPPTSLVKVSLSTVVDQALSQEVPMLSHTELATRRRRYLSMGDPPLPEHDPTDAQLSALSFLVMTGAPPPHLWIWGFGGRTVHGFNGR